MNGEEHIQKQMLKQVQWITERKGHEEAAKLLPLLDKTFHLLQAARKHIEDEEYSEAVSLLDALLDANKHPYLFTSTFVVQAGIHGRDALRVAEWRSECLLWVLYTLSVIEAQEPELRYADDLAEMYHLLIDEMYQARDSDPGLVRQKMMDMAWDGVGRRDALSEGLAELAMSHLLVMAGDFDGAQRRLEAAEPKLDVDHDSLVWAMRCCVWAEVKANTSQFDEATIATQQAEEIYRGRGRTAYAFGLARDQGYLLLLQSDWSRAGDAFQRAVDAGNEMYRAALVRADQEEWLADAGDLYRHAGYTLARDDRLREAVTILEQGRARGLGDAVARDHADLERVSVHNAALYRDYHNAIQDMQRLEKTVSGVPVSVIRESVREARANLREAVERIREIEGYGHFLMDASFDDISAAVEPENPLVYLVTTELGSMALILHRQREANDITVEPLWFGHLTSEWLRKLLRGPSGAGGKGWLGVYEEVRSRRQPYQLWLDEIDNVTRDLWELMGPIVDRLSSLGVGRAVLIPGGLLALLPLHAAWTERSNSRRYALDDVVFTYAPSARTLHQARRFADTTRTETLLAVKDPSLPNATREVAAVTSLFDAKQTKILNKNRTKRAKVLAALPKAQVFYACCHGRADLMKGTGTCLSAASDEPLTVECLSRIPLGGGRLVLLSACETGIIGENLPDEVVGLPGAFMRLGYAGVVASLWFVDDLCTATLIERFCRLWRKDGLSPAEALHTAQQWLRSEDGHAHPFDWAAFYLTGV